MDYMYSPYGFVYGNGDNRIFPFSLQLPIRSGFRDFFGSSETEWARAARANGSADHYFKYYFDTGEHTVLGEYGRI